MSLLPEPIRQRIPTTQQVLGCVVFYALMWGASLLLVLECLP
ncbi:hypothetical protein ACU81Q_14620 [Komagataeibacter melomenusus]